MKLSAVIIAKNAEELITDCIKSVDFADEILVIDDGSTDKTRDIAKKFGARVIEKTTTSFAEKRNIGLKEAKGEWVLYIDTDERVSDKLKENIQVVIANNFSRHPELARTVSDSGSENKIPGQARNDEGREFVAYKLHRQNFYLGNHPWPKIEQLERLFRKSQLKEWYGELHESPKVEGSIGILNGYLLHYTHRDLSSMLSKTIEWSDKEAKLRYDAHHPNMTLWRFPRVMMTAFWDSYIGQQGYKAGTMGLIESMYQAFSMFVTYAKLWELQNKVSE